MNFTESKFEAALCMDTDPSGSLSQYYPFDKDAQPIFMLFNQDEDREPGDIDRSKDSQFWQFLTQTINGLVQNDDSKFDTFELEWISMESEKARLYDGEMLEWGILKGFVYASSDASSDADNVCYIYCDRDKVELEYWFNVNGMEIDFREFIEENPPSEDGLNTPLRTELFQNKVMETKRVNLAFFQDSKVIKNRLDSMTD